LSAVGLCYVARADAAWRFHPVIDRDGPILAATRKLATETHHALPSDRPLINVFVLCKKRHPGCQAPSRALPFRPVELPGLAARHSLMPQ
jgi:hypothetical protein